MSWRERLRECVYIAPSGASFTLQFDDLTREVGKKAPVTEFPGQNQGAVQDLGQATTRYPFLVYISGVNYDVTADRFWDALNESGPGELQHPRYGNRQVVPVSVQQREAFVGGAGRAVFTIEFVEALEQRLELPSGIQLAPAAITGGALDAIEAAAATIDDITIEEPGALAQLKAGALAVTSTVKGAFDTVADFTDEVRATIDGTVRAITREIDTLVQAPADMVRALAQLYAIPLNVVSNVEAKINGYATLFGTFGTLFVSRTERYRELFDRIRGANANAAVSAAAGATAEGEVETRAAAARIASTLAGYQDTAAAIDAEYDAQLAARQVVSDALNRVLSLNLSIEQSQILESDEVLVALVDRLYREIDDIDELIAEFIRYNQLQGDEIVIVPKGRTVRWYE